MEPMSCLSKVIAIKELTHDVKEIALELVHPPKVVFKAGQYIAIEVTEMRDGLPRQNNRPYSIVSPPEEDRVIKLCVNLVQGGPGPSHLHALDVGSELRFLHPFGYFTVNTGLPSCSGVETVLPLLFVATGTGIAPIRSMIEHLIHQKTERPMRLVWGLRHGRDLYYQDDFVTLSRIYPLLKTTTTLSQPSSDWPGAVGRVTTLLSREETQPENLEAYLCGNMDMIREVRAILLEKGLNKQAIHFEKFY